ncbi:Hypothetical predicted protein [Mytilus galloprovincialis]|uniref:Uncharacterized protein n=1 Tax=Mytilus galloprovincialis TaxID=29158 RepID=A0A8B6GJM5_MYTGA|nr:Hypothetical predicted protein [Mytilus galloprovincialis]
MAYKAYGNALSVSNLQSAFRKTGIYPFTKDIIMELPLTPSEAFISDIVEYEEALNSAVVVRENENVSEREEVVSDEDNVGVVSEGEVGFEVCRSVVSEGEIGLESDSQKPGTSGVSRCVNEWAIDIESESESEIREDEKCFVCKKFVPEAE